MKFQAFSLAFAAILAFAVSGCDEVREGGDDAARDSSEMKAAMAAERQGDFDKAIAMYERVAQLYPDASLPHLQLASILHEYRKDYIGAIYNYRRYIETSSDKSNFVGISNRIEKVEQYLSAEFIAKLPDRELSPEESRCVVNNIVAMTNAIARLKVENDMLVSSNAALVRDLRKLTIRYDRLGVTLEKLKNDVSAGGSRLPSARNSRLGLEYEGLDTYEVTPGDSLSLIAKMKYGDANMWPIIANANSNKVDSAGRVRVGTILVIPPAPEEDE